MQHTWRWFGPDDHTTLQDIRQAGATGIVTALHHIPTGEIWTTDEINKRKELIKQGQLQWSVVESIPVHEDIKRQCGEYKKYIKNYQTSLENLAQCGIHIVCYNFMPILDWTRTDLAFPLGNGARALRFDLTAFAAFDCFILQRDHAKADYSPSLLTKAEQYYAQLSDSEKQNLSDNIIAGLPGAEESYSLDALKQHIKTYQEINADKLRENLKYFLEAIIPTAEKHNILLAIHPDDPPCPILGLPRIMSKQENDIDWLFKNIASKNCGITFCSGSYGASKDNDLPAILKKHAERVYFAHLRSTQREEDLSADNIQGVSSFYEADHLQGNADLIELIRLLLIEEKRRKDNKNKQNEQFEQIEIPMRPDHGHQIIDDLHKKVNPGYSTLGRLKGLAEIRGVESAIRRFVI